MPTRIHEPSLLRFLLQYPLGIIVLTAHGVHKRIKILDIKSRIFNVKRKLETCPIEDDELVGDALQIVPLHAKRIK